MLRTSTQSQAMDQLKRKKRWDKDQDKELSKSQAASSFRALLKCFPLKEGLSIQMLFSRNLSKRQG